MTEVSIESKQQFMQDKFHYDSLSQAIRLAKQSGCSDKQTKDITLEKQKYKKMYLYHCDKMLRAMPLSSNVMRIEGCWHGIRYLDEKANLGIKIDILKQEDVHLLRRDSRHERDLSRAELNTFLPAMINEDELELYKQKLAVRASELVLTYTGVLVGATEDVVEPDEPIAPVSTSDVLTVSSHAGRRYVQRVLGIAVGSEADAETYRRANMEEVNKAVLEGFANATQVWEEKADEITYHLDDNNYMYVKGVQHGNPNIITMYEEDFGFTKDINRMITNEQLAVLARAKDELMEADGKLTYTKAKAEHDTQAINDQITVLESQIALLVAERTTMSIGCDQVSKEHRLARDKYTAEFNKLFKKWDA